MQRVNKKPPPNRNRHKKSLAGKPPSAHAMFKEMVKICKPLWIQRQPDYFDFVVDGSFPLVTNHLARARLTYIPEKRQCQLGMPIAEELLAFGDPVDSQLLQLNEAFSYTRITRDYRDEVVRARANIPCPYDERDLKLGLRRLFSDFESAINCQELWVILKSAGARRCVIGRPDWNAA